jgi:hypothetical protein
MLRRMSYGELLTSQALAYNIQVKAGSSSTDPDVGFQMSQAAVMEYQFKTCVMEHNLEDESGRALDFGKIPRDVHVLDPRIGGEIASIIERMHQWQQSFPNSETPSASVSSTNGAPGMATTPSTGSSPTSSSE